MCLHVLNIMVLNYHESAPFVGTIKPQRNVRISTKMFFLFTNYKKLVFGVTMEKPLKEHVEHHEMLIISE